MSNWMDIKSVEAVKTFNKEIGQDVIIEVGCKYVFSVPKPKNKKDRTDNGLVVEVLGFNDSFMGDAIVRYIDTKRIGNLSISYLLPYEVEFFNYD